MANATSERTPGLVSLETLANGELLADTFRVAAVSISTGINKIGRASFELLDGAPATGEFPVTDAVFDAAEHRPWILLFDKAEGIFGEHTAVTTATERYANQASTNCSSASRIFPAP